MNDKDPEWHQLQLEKRDQRRLAFYERQAFLAGLDSSAPPKAKALITDTLYPMPVYAP